MAYSIRRSEPMALCDLYIQPETAFSILAELGEMGCVQFVDTKEDLQIFQRSYVTEVRRFSEFERKLRFLETEISNANIPFEKAQDHPSALPPNETLAFENTLDKWEGDILEMTTNENSLKKNYLELVEMNYILENIGPLLGDEEGDKQGKGLSAVSNLQYGGQLFIITGVVDRKRSFPFEIMLWRISRGNIYYRLASEDNIIENQTGQDVERRRVAFLAVCQGEELYIRAEKVCNGFRASLYPIPRSYEERTDLECKLSTTISDLEQVLMKTRFHKCKALRVIAKQWNNWSVQVAKSAAVYHNLNRFNYDVSKNCLIGRCWVAERDLNRVQNCLEAKSKEVGSNITSFMYKTTVPEDEAPPTFYRTNKFTSGFQGMIDGYGASKYRELNPGLYTIIIFPFLFAVMFGDIGHGIILTALALWMIQGEKKFMMERSTNEIWNIMFAGRYVVLLLGMFSIFTGFLYNDFFGVYFNLPTSWLNHLVLTLNESDYTDDKLLNNEVFYLDASNYRSYVFGMEPLWKLSSNKIMIENSVKMKISVILGIIHMEFGLILSLVNYVYFKKRYLIVLQFIPEIMFLTCLFGWLVILIFMKWFMYAAGDPNTGSGCAPQILIIFIEMFLLKETQPIAEGCNAYLFPGQRYLQMGLLFSGLLCIPIMLLGTPLYLMMHHRKKRKELESTISTFRKYQRSGSDKEQDMLKAELKKHTISMGDLMIHQAIHTVEYVLSTVSHTASYLRLWALSLAHAALSEMLWSMVLSKLALQDHSIIGAFKIFVIFAIWAFFSVCILVVMEGLSAFLHTLRLHWVEFMTKFFEGGGWMFHPFNFNELVCEHAKTLSKVGISKKHVVSHSRRRKKY